MNCSRARRLLTTVATGALFALPASAAMAEPPPHANAGGRGQQRTAVSEDADGDDSNAPGHEYPESRHPSGRDRTDHQDNPQGNAQSDPDDDGVGMDRDGRGEDQPGTDGGAYSDDQDGNNGCGNDQDFEDDNNGLCGGLGAAHEQSDTGDGQQPSTRGDEPPTNGDHQPSEQVITAPTEDDHGDDVPGGLEGGADGAGGGTTAVAAEDAVALADGEAPDLADDRDDEVEVLGTTAERPVPATATVVSAAPSTDTLPRTGAASTIVLGLGGLLSIASGAALRRRSPR